MYKPVNLKFMFHKCVCKKASAALMFKENECDRGAIGT